MARPKRKVAAAIQARYDAAGNSRRFSGWTTPSTGPNAATAGLEKMRSRARDASRNEWAGASSARVMTTNLIGVGIVCRIQSKDRAQKERISRAWSEWVEEADADGVSNFYGLQSLVARTWFVSGEVFVRHRYRRLADGLSAPYQVQVIEPDFVPAMDADSWPGMPTGNRMRQGIELDAIGRRVAYWMYKQHPGERCGQIEAGMLVRVPASAVLHIYTPSRPGQLRGVPETASIIAKLRSIMNFDDAIIERQHLSNLFAMFIKRDATGGAGGSIDPLTGKPQVIDSSGMPIAAMEPGISQELLPGEDVVFSDPPDSGANYAEFMRIQNQSVAAGSGLPYELMAGDIRNVSDRSLRVVINEFRRYCEQIQWTMLIPRFCRPVQRAWASACGLSGALSVADIEASRNCDWQPHGWAYIHPVQDAQGKALEVEAGFRSRSSVIAERGDDPELVDEERAADELREQGLGLLDEDDPVVMAQADLVRAEADLARQKMANAKERSKLDSAAAEAGMKSAAEQSAATVLRAQAEAKRQLADAALADARRGLANAEARLLSEKAEAEMLHTARCDAEHAARMAQINGESAARIESLREAAAQAAAESALRLQAIERAEVAAQEQRDLVLSTERRRAEVAALELEAARIGLDELRQE